MRTSPMPMPLSHPIPLRLPPDQLAWLDAQRLAGRSRSQAIRDAIAGAMAGANTTTTTPPPRTPARRAPVAAHD